MQLTSFITQKTLWKPNNHSLSFVLMRVIEWLMWTVWGNFCECRSKWMISSCCSRGTSTAMWVCEGGWLLLVGVGVGLNPFLRLEVFVFLHQLSSQFTIYLPWTVLTLSSFHLWQIPDTLGQASLETSYSIVHTTVNVRGILHTAWHTGLASPYTAT